MRTADRGEFEQVFRSGYPSVLRTAYLVLHDRGRAEEVTQDGFLRLYQRWSQQAQLIREPPGPCSQFDVGEPAVLPICRGRAHLS